jgi:tRNA pseudouridine55 synthase
VTWKNLKTKTLRTAANNVNAPRKAPTVRLHGWLILDKPLSITSAHAVAKVKRLLRPEKIGHAGTLDPLASGILPLALGEATKTVPYMMDAQKAYSFSVAWGQERSTDDAQGEVTASSPKRPSEAEIRAVMGQFIGDIQQLPPSYSAIKLGGVRAYDAAREGAPLELKPRPVVVHRLVLEAQDADSATFLVECGKGTYVRSLARDMGRALGCLGYVCALRRLSVGKFGETRAFSLEMLEELVHKGDLTFVQPVDAALDDILARDVTTHLATRLKQGMTIPLFDELLEKGNNTLIRVRCEGRLVALGEYQQGMIKPVRVFNL